MFHVHSSGISNMKNIKGNIYLAKGSVSSKHRVEPESKKWHSQLTQYSTKCNAFILKCFLQFICTNLDGSQKESSNFLNLLQKEGVTQKGEGGGGVPSEKAEEGGSNPGENNECRIYEVRKRSVF